MRLSSAPLFLFLLALTQTVSSQGSFNQEFSSDVSVPEGFKKNRTSYSAIMDVLESTRTEVTDEELERLKQVPLEVIFSALGEYQLNYATAVSYTHLTLPTKRIV